MNIVLYGPASKSDRSHVVTILLKHYPKANIELLERSPTAKECHNYNLVVYLGLDQVTGSNIDYRETRSVPYAQFEEWLLS